MAYKRNPSLRIFWYLVAFGCLVSVVGDQALRFLNAVGWLVAELVLGINRDPYVVPMPWPSFRPNIYWLYAAVSGSLSTGVFAPWFIRRLSRASRYILGGAFLGMSAAILNTIILTLIHIGFLSRVDSSFDSSLAFRLVRTYLPISLALSGVPATIIGAAAGAGAAMYFRRALWTRSDRFSTAGDSTPV